MCLDDRPVTQVYKKIPSCSSMVMPFQEVPLTVFNREPHSGSGASEVSSWKCHFRTASEFPMPFWTQKGQRYFGNDRNCFRKVLVPFRTRNRRKHFIHLTISYVCLNLWLPFVTAPITIHYKLHSGPSGGLIRVYLCPWYIYVYSTYKHLSHLRPFKTAAELWATPAFFLDFVSCDHAAVGCVPMHQIHHGWRRGKDECDPGGHWGVPLSILVQSVLMYRKGWGLFDNGK